MLFCPPMCSLPNNTQLLLGLQNVYRNFQTLGELGQDDIDVLGDINHNHDFHGQNSLLTRISLLILASYFHCSKFAEMGRDILLVPETYCIDGKRLQLTALLLLSISSY